MGIIRRIGDGKDTKFFDNWIPRDHKLKPICAKSAAPPEFVSALINHATCTWNREELNTHLIQPDVEVVLNIPLSTIVLKDRWAWHYENSGHFSERPA
jgi:hypothetical protein